MQTLTARLLSNAGVSRRQPGAGGIGLVDEGGGGIELRAELVGGTGVTIADDTTNGATVRSGTRAKLELFGTEVVDPDDTGEGRFTAQDGDGAQVGVWLATRNGGTADQKYARIGSAFDAPTLEVLASGEFGAFGAAPVARPVVPLTGPVVQDVIDALVALGWVTQSD